MPSTHDDSPGSESFSTPRSTAPGIPGKAAWSTDTGPTAAGSSTDRWLGNYMADCMAAAGVDTTTARRVAVEMQPVIVSAFSTLARLDRAGFVMDTIGGANVWP